MHGAALRSEATLRCGDDVGPGLCSCKRKDGLTIERKRRKGDKRSKPKQAFAEGQVRRFRAARSLWTG